MSSQLQEKKEFLSAHLVSRYGKLQPKDANKPNLPQFGPDLKDGNYYHWSGLVDFSPHHTEQPLKVALASYPLLTDRNIRAKTFIHIQDQENISHWQLHELRNGIQTELFYRGAEYIVPFATVPGNNSGHSRALLFEVTKARKADSPIYLEDINPDKTIASLRFFAHSYEAMNRLRMIAEAIKSAPTA